MTQAFCYCKGDQPCTRLPPMMVCPGHRQPLPHGFPPCMLGDNSGRAEWSPVANLPGSATGAALPCLALLASGSVEARAPSQCAPTAPVVCFGMASQVRKPATGQLYDLSSSSFHACRMMGCESRRQGRVPAAHQNERLRQISASRLHGLRLPSCSSMALQGMRSGAPDSLDGVEWLSTCRPLPLDPWRGAPPAQVAGGGAAGERAAVQQCRRRSASSEAHRQQCLVRTASTGDVALGSSCIQAQLGLPARLAAPPRAQS